MPKGVTDAEFELVSDLSPEAATRLRRLRWLAWLMDRSIPIGGGRRIGLDPIIGLIPGLGDWLGAAISTVVIYEAVRLGLPVSVLARMLLNIGVEAAVGAVPLLGDVFDAAWQANQRNLRLIERHYDATLPPRSLRGLLVVFVVVIGIFLIGTAWLLIAIARLLWSFLQA